MSIEFPVTSASIAAVAAFILSLFFTYFPGVRTWWAKLTQEAKSGLTFVLIILISIAVYFLGCYKIVVTGVTCDQNGVWQLVMILLSTLVSSQSTFTLTKNLFKVKDVIDIKAKKAMISLKL